MPPEYAKTPCVPEHAGTLGIMVCRREGSPPFTGKEYLRELCLSSSRLGITAFIFFPDSPPFADHPNTGSAVHITSVPGYAWTPRGWKAGDYPVPDVVYDRCLFKHSGETAAAARCLGILKRHRSLLLGRGLPGKRRVYELLKREPSLLPHLPHTLPYTGSVCLEQALSRYGGELFMKPSGGSFGSHTLYVRSSGSKAFLQGRTRSNEMFSSSVPMHELDRWVRIFTGRRPFLIQPFLRLTGRDGSPFDVRALVQKDQAGQWNLAGMAIRRGPAEGITSNLHGGGRALPVLPFLETQYGSSSAKDILERLRQLSGAIPPLLEGGFGRLGELGIDFGVDHDGRIWLLEVNSKPGRLSFKQTGDGPAAQRSVENPLRYARYLLLRQLRRVNT